MASGSAGSATPNSLPAHSSSSKGIDNSFRNRDIYDICLHEMPESKRIRGQDPLLVLRLQDTREDETRVPQEGGVQMKVKWDTAHGVRGI